MLGFSGHFARQDYLHAVDKTCARNTAAATATPARGIDDIVARTAAEHRALAAVKTPGSARKLRAEILALDGSASTRAVVVGRPRREGRAQADIAADPRAARQQRGQPLRASSACAPAPASEPAHPCRGVTTPQVAGATAPGPSATLSHALTSAEPWPT